MLGDVPVGLLAGPGVAEQLELRGPVGFMAFHGGELEKVTDTVARDAAERSGASYYGLVHLDPEPVHIPSTALDPARSAALAAFLAHVHTVITVHGYGRKRLSHSVLLGGGNRGLAHHLACHLRPRLPGYDFCDDLDHIPEGLRGLHPDNPVNRPRGGGVQIELPPAIRWNWAAHGWSDRDGVSRAPQVEALITTLARAVRAWPSPATSA